MAVRLSALRADRPLTPERFLAFISVRGWVDPRALLRLEGLGKLKKSNDLIGTLTRDLSACSIVPQRTTLPCVPLINFKINFNNLEIVWIHEETRIWRFLIFTNWRDHVDRMGQDRWTSWAKHQQTPGRRENCPSTSEEDWYRQTTWPSPKRGREEEEEEECSTPTL
jgi:hypothetical protein